MGVPSQWQLSQINRCCHVSVCLWLCCFSNGAGPAIAIAGSRRHAHSSQEVVWDCPLHVPVSDVPCLLGFWSKSQRQCHCCHIKLQHSNWQCAVHWATHEHNVVLSHLLLHNRYRF